MMTHRELRDKFRIFWEASPRNHRLVPSGPLVLQNDATTLFTSSGMQPLVPYLTGEPHQSGKRIYNIQPCIRTQDIDEVGDNQHTTFFEMMGNWSLGDYFKEEQLLWMWEFFTQELGLPEKKLYVTFFKGGSGVARDNETYQIWKKLGIPEERISFYGADSNWWSRSGPPDKMPAGEIGGPDTEVFYDFGKELGLHEKSTFKDKKCRPNCDCGRFLEIGNSVFIQYKKEADGSISELSQKNIDYGGGLERLLAAKNDNPDVFYTDLFEPIIAELQNISNKKYNEHKNLNRYIRIISDHLKASVMLIHNGVDPSNKEHGYVVRRLLRKAIWYGRNYLMINGSFIGQLVKPVINIYKDNYPDLLGSENRIKQLIDREEGGFLARIDKGTNEIPRLAKKYSHKKLATNDTIDVIVEELDEWVSGEMLFHFYQSYGFPPDLVRDILQDQGWKLYPNFVEVFYKEKAKHQDESRSASAGKFKGGLADHSDQVLKYHTATHLLHQALKDVFGPTARQEGSNITQERLRFDVQLDRKPTDDEIKQVEGIVNQKIVDGLEVQFKIMPRQEADRIGAASFFNEKYGDEVKVYFIGDYSKEFCGGPHVSNTKEIGKIRISRVKKIGSKLIRLYVERDSLIQ